MKKLLYIEGVFLQSELKNRNGRMYPFETLNREGLQSDLRLAEAFIQSRANKGQGSLKIRAELRGKGVSDFDIEIAFAHCDINWFEQVALVAARRFGDEPPENAKERAKRNRFLQQRGFSFDEIGTLN